VARASVRENGPAPDDGQRARRIVVGQFEPLRRMITQAVGKHYTLARLLAHDGLSPLPRECLAPARVRKVVKRQCGLLPASSEDRVRRLVGKQ
jgi:hypothetical protein